MAVARLSMDVVERVAQLPQVQPFLAAQKVSRVIYVPGRLVNIVTAKLGV